MSTTVEAEFAMALSLQRRGELAAAEMAYRELLDRHGPRADAEHMLALTLHAQKRHAEALAWFERAGARAGDPTLWSNHAAALIALGRAAEAAVLCRRALEINPQHFGAWLNLGVAGEIERNFNDAIAALQTALRLRPGNAAAALALARSQLRAGFADSALRTLAVFAEGADPELDLLRCEAALESGNAAAALALLASLARHESVRARALVLQARIAEHGHADAACALLEQALALDPENSDACARRAWLDIRRGETEAGLQRLRVWLDRHPADWNAANVYLFACQNSPRIGAAALLAEHRRLRPAPAPAVPWPAGWRRQDGKLRIGWLSAHPADGLLRVFFGEVYRELRRRNHGVEHVVYALRDRDGHAAADCAWARRCRFVGDLGDSRLVERVRADGLDVLVDLAGRAKGNRLAALAARMAPVQVAWFDAIHPSGVDAIDYLITDPRLSPPDADAHFSEKLLRLAYGRLAYCPLPAPPPGTDGVAGRTLVSFNRFAKLNDDVVAVWAAILRELPDWTLRLRGEGGGDADVAAALRGRFGRHGVAPGRIAVEEFGSHADAMQAYRAAAIALDPFPFSGCATTCDALWMGLPVVTLPGDTLASRQTASLLDVLGQEAWIAQDADAYVSKTVALAHDEEARHDWRLQARDRVVPALCDVPRFSAELLQALRAVAQK